MPINRLKEAAHRCLILTSYQLTDKLFRGGLSQDIIREILDSNPHIQPYLPTAPSERSQIPMFVFQMIQARLKAQEQLIQLILQSAPKGKSPIKQSERVKYFEEVTKRLKESLRPIREYIIGNKSLKEVFSLTCLNDVITVPEEPLPFEMFMDRMIFLCRNPENKKEKLDRLERFEQLLDEDLPTDKDSLKIRLQELVFSLNNSVSLLLSPEDKKELFKVLDEEIKNDPNLQKLYEQLDGDITKLITVVFTSIAQSHFLNENFGQNTKPQDFYFSKFES